MARETYVYRPGLGVIPKSEAPRVDATYVRTDGMDPIRSLADGRMYDSKSAYYASVRKAGCEIVGNDRGGFGQTPGYRSGDVASDIKRTIGEMRRGS